MHRQGIVKLERGEREPAWATILALADALGVPCDQFRGATPDPAPAKKGRPPKTTAKDTPPAPEKPTTRKPR
jgi:hypothetical protein